MINKICSLCGKTYVALGNNRKYCSDCREQVLSIWDSNRTPNTICEFCGKYFYRSPSQINSIKCCSQDCDYRLRHKAGIFTYWKCLEEELYIDLKEYLYFLHWGKEMPILKMAEELKTNRHFITRFMKKNNIPYRSISEDNYRRYAKMTNEQINEQTSAANNKMRQLMKDPAYKELHVKRVLSSQGFRESEPERLIKAELSKRGIKYCEQHQFACWFVDITFPSSKLAVEVDGDYWHSLPEQKLKDAKKDGWLISHNWIILRILESEIKKDVRSCVDRIEHLLKVS